MTDRYILVSLLGTKDAETEEFPFIPLYAKAGDVAELPTFAAMDISDIEPTDNENYVAAGIIGIYDPQIDASSAIPLYADREEWVSLSRTASEHLTGCREGTA